MGKVLGWIAGFAVGIFVLPLLMDAIGIPGFDVLLTALFGEESIWAYVFTALVIALLVIGINKMSKREA